MPLLGLRKPPAVPVVLTCAWHGILAELLEQSGSNKTFTVTGRKNNANKARAKPEMDVWRKHEAEIVYVANSEPAKWLRGGGRAGVAERDLISGEPNLGEAGRYMMRRYVLPREAFLL